MATISFLITVFSLFLPLTALAQDYKTSDCPPNVEYTDGVDVNGWAVSGADIEPSKTIDSVALDLKLRASDYSDNESLKKAAPNAELNIGDIDLSVESDATASDCNK